MGIEENAVNKVKNQDIGETDALFQEYVGREVILDVSSPYVYVGTFKGSSPHCLILEDADVHDLRDTSTTRELYVQEAKRLGVNRNRKRVLVRIDEIVSVSALEDVID